MAELKAAQRRERDAAVKEFNSLAEEADVPRIAYRPSAKQDSAKV